MLCLTVLWQKSRLKLVMANQLKELRESIADAIEGSQDGIIVVNNFFDNDRLWKLLLQIWKYRHGEHT